jgi:hypothetical protein
MGLSRVSIDNIHDIERKYITITTGMDKKLGKWMSALWIKDSEGIDRMLISTEPNFKSEESAIGFFEDMIKKIKALTEKEIWSLSNEELGKRIFEE